MARLRWNGDRLLAGIRAAQLAAVDETTQAAAQQAAASRSGKAANLRHEPAVRAGNRVTGRWGLFPDPRGGDVFYELFIETGTATQPGDHAKRRAGDQQYPQLAGRIRAKVGTGG